jgi:hypothetical protein
VVADEGGLPETLRPGGGVTVARTAEAAAEALRRVTAQPRPLPAVIPSWRDCAEELRGLLRQAAERDLPVAARTPVVLPKPAGEPVTLPAGERSAPVQGS